MDIRAATMLLPIGVFAFVIVGDLRSTLVSDYTYMHTVIIYVIIWLFLFTVSADNTFSNYASHSFVGLWFTQNSWISVSSL